MNKIHFLADDEQVKAIGRTILEDKIRWFALSGSGVEFEFEGKYISVTLEGDDESAKANGNKEVRGEFPRFAIYLNNERIVDSCLINREETIEIYNGNRKKMNIRIIKLSEAPMSIMGIKSFEADDSATIKPGKDKALKIEIIGDSITCGYGVDDEVAFSTATEDVTAAYGYLAVEKMNADYSMVSFSGYGIISGYTELDEKLTTQLVPDYYEMIGYSRGMYNGRAITNEKWDFTKFRPDIVVINLGTNDDSYCRDFQDRQYEFANEYAKFLEMVRKNNPDAFILCAFGVMTDRLYPYIEKAAGIYKSKTGDEKIEITKLSTHREENGYAADWHPSKVSHKIAAEELYKALEKVVARIR